MTESTPTLDPQQENRRLRAAMEQMRSRQKLARGGVAIAVIGFVASRQSWPVIPESQVGTFRIVLGIVGLAIIALSAIPFLRSLCPKCNRPYHSAMALLRSADDPAPCKHCGFQINRHVSRYS